jgi:hypothetical protein
MNNKCTKLTTTINLMNLCIVHGIMNKFANEFFTLLRLHLLHEPNCLPKILYVAKTLTR